ncbi:transposase [Streptomyces iakyrus]|uniref:transposase n=1 Tax=Streptomyces iakyrus TaxID=68219 RepID=UPI0036E541DF
MRMPEVLVPAPGEGTFHVKQPTGPYPHVRVQDDGRAVVSQSGSVLLVETVRKTDLDQAIPQVLAPWRKPRAVHDSGKVLLDVALAVAVGGLPRGRRDAAVWPALFGPVASDPIVSRLIDTLAASGEKALQAIRSARSEVHRPVWSLPVRTPRTPTDRSRSTSTASWCRALRQGGCGRDLEEDLRPSPPDSLRRPWPGRNRRAGRRPAQSGPPPGSSALPRPAPAECAPSKPSPHCPSGPPSPTLAG